LQTGGNLLTSSGRSNLTKGVLMSSSNRVRFVFIAFALLVAVALAGCPEPTLAVPDVVGMTQGGAELSLLNTGLAVGTVTEVFSDTVPADQVISQDPEADSQVSSGSTVDLVVSKGPNRVAVPDVIGILPAAAQAAIVAAGLAVGNQEEQYSTIHPLGYVMGQHPAEGTLVEPGSAVDLVVSLGTPGGEGEGEGEGEIEGEGEGEGEGEPEEGTVTLPGHVQMEMVWIPAGSFMMGMNPGEPGGYWVNEEPRHQVTISKGFWLGKYEVTQAQWKAVMGEYHMTYSGPGSENYPVRGVSWGNAAGVVEGYPLFSFVSAINAALPGTNFRLPTEAEWEYACRAGTTTRFFWGEDLDGTEINNYAWNYGNWDGTPAGLTPHPVGLKLPNPWGLYDMIGNVYEWVQDYYELYPDHAVSDPTGAAGPPESQNCKVYRGGHFSTHPNSSRSATRFVWCQGDNVFEIGFRVARP